MSDLDLTAAVKAARKMCHDNTAVDFVGDKRMEQWTDLMAHYAVTAAAPLIERAVREKVAAEIEAWEATSADDVLTRGAWSDGVRFGLHVAVDIARETP